MGHLFDECGGFLERQLVVSFDRGLACGAGKGVCGKALSGAEFADPGEHVLEESADIFLLDGGGDGVQLDGVASEGLDLESDVFKFAEIADHIGHVGGGKLDGDRHQKPLRERAVDAVQDALEKDAFVRGMLVDQDEAAGNGRHDVGVFEDTEQTESRTAEVGDGSVLRHEPEVGARFIFRCIRRRFGRDRQVAFFRFSVRSA